MAAVLHQSFAAYESLYTIEAYAATTPQTPQVKIRMKEGPVWVALHKGQIVGTASAVLDHAGVYVRGMGVLPTARRLGIGNSLLEEIERFAVATDNHLLYLSTTPFLAEAIRLYTAFGFRASHAGPHDLFGTRLITMEKKTLGSRDSLGASGVQSLTTATFASLQRIAVNIKGMFMARVVNRTVIERYYKELWNQWNFALVDQLLNDQISFHGLPFRGSLGVEMRGRAAFRDYMRRVQSTFPDFHNRVEELVSENDRVVARLTHTGTHHGEILGMAPTGRRISYAGAAFFRVENSQISQGWVFGDMEGLRDQLRTETSRLPSTVR